MERSRQIRNGCLAVITGIYIGSILSKDTITTSLEGIIVRERFASLDERSKKETFTHALALKDPEKMGRSLDNLPITITRDSVRITIHQKTPQSNVEKWDLGSGLQVYESNVYKVFLTAKHLFKPNMVRISFDQPQFAEYNIISSAAEDTWIFEDKEKDMGIIVIRNSSGHKSKDIKYGIDSSLSNALGDGELYGISFPGSLNGSGINFMPVKIPKNEITQSENYIILKDITSQGASGTVLTDSEGNIVSVLYAISVDPITGNDIILTTKVGDTLHSLVLEASKTLNYPFFN